MRILLISLLAIFSLSIHAQQSEQDSKGTYSATLSKNKIVIGDQIIYNISVVVPNLYKVTFPSYKDSLMKGVELVKNPLVEEVKRKDAKKEFVLKMLITSFDSGSYELPSVPIAISNGNGVDTIRTNTIPFIVNTVPRDTTIKGLYDIKAPIEEPLTFAEVAPWAFGGLLLAALIVLLIIYLNRRRQNKPFSFIQKPKDPPHVIALRELEKIKQEKLWATDNHKYYYTRLIDVLRIYIENRYGVNAMEQTSEEIMHGLKQIDFPKDDLYNDLHETLTLADLVKFAKYTAVVSDNERNLKFAYDFVEKTKQEVEINPVVVAEEVDAKSQEIETTIVKEQDKNIQN